jgi:hypothetical protein
MATHNELTDPSAGSSSVGRRSRWVNEHGLLAYTLIAYGISWSLLIGGFLGSRARHPELPRITGLSESSR